MTAIQITEINSKDVIRYKEFITKGLIQDENNFRITPSDDLNEPFPTNDAEDSFTLGAIMHDSLIGVVSFKREGFNGEKLRHKGLLFRLYVEKDYRKQGIGKKLIYALIDRARKIKGIEQINLTVIANNEHAKKMYEKIKGKK